MRLEIRRRGVNVTEKLRDYLKERLRLALGRFGRHIDLVRVYIRHVNGPRGGLGKKCRIVVELRRDGGVIVTGKGTDVSAAITGTTSRAGFAVRRRLKRRLARRRPPRRPFRPMSITTFGAVVGPPNEIDELARHPKDGVGDARPRGEGGEMTL